MPEIDKVLITAVVNYTSGERVSEIASWHNFKSIYCCLAKGTASKAILRQLGISDSRKEIVSIYADRKEADLILKDLKDEMHLEDHHMGIAFVKPADSHKGTEKEKEGIDMTEAEQRDFRALSIIVNKGYAEDIILELSRSDIRGATIIPSYVYNHETDSTDRNFARKIIEKETVLVVTTQEKAEDLMNRIGSDEYLKNRAGVFVISEKVLETVGVHYF